MKAIRVYMTGQPEVMKLEEIPDPVPGPGQVIIKVQAAGVNPVDTYIRAGGQGYGPQLPYTPGLDGAGEIFKTGPEVTGIKAGDRVFFSGGSSGSYAQFTLCEADLVYPLPDNADFPQGASVGVPYATAYRAIFQRGEAKPDDRVLVHGASGGVGLAAVQLLTAAGMEVLATAGTDKTRQSVASQGAVLVLDHHDPGHFEMIMEATDGQGVDVILEMLSNVNLGRDLKLLKKHGRVVVIGCRGDVEISPRDLMSRDADVRGMSLMNAGKKTKARIYKAIQAGLSSGVLNPVVGTKLPLSKAVQAHHQIIEQKASGNIVLLPWE